MGEFIERLTDAGAEKLGHQVLDSIARGNTLGSALLEVFEMPLPDGMTPEEWDATTLRTAVWLIADSYT